MGFPIVKIGPTDLMYRVYPQPLYDSVTLADGTLYTTARFFYTAQGESDPFSGELKTLRDTNLKKPQSIEQVGTRFITKIMKISLFTKFQRDGDLLIEGGIFRFVLNGTESIQLPLWKLRHGYELKSIGKVNALTLEMYDSFYVEVEWPGGMCLSDKTRVSIFFEGSLFKESLQ